MNDIIKKQIVIIKLMDSEDAATWLMETYPIDDPEYGNAIILLNHRSWKKSDQIRLARHYFRKIPFASSKPYEVFASFMSISNFIKIINEYLPKKKADLNLLIYLLEPVLMKNLKSKSDKDIVDRFLVELKSKL